MTMTDADAGRRLDWLPGSSISQDMPGFWRTVMELIRSLDEGPRLARDLGVPDAQAQGRGLRLLVRNLSPAQREQFARCNYFDVVGSESGTRYRIQYGHVLNVERLDENGRRLCVLCFTPHGRLPVADIMLAQKIALELFESDALKVANISVPWDYSPDLGFRITGRHVGRHG